MSIDNFEAGRSLTGVLLTYSDGKQSTFPATLRFDPESLVEIEVADAAGFDSFFGESPTHPSVWFRGDEHIPAQCVFQSLGGSMTLSRIRTTRRSQNPSVRGATFVADEVVLRATRAGINEPPLFDQLISRFDGLADWWGERNVVLTRHTTDIGLSRRVEITTREDVEPVTWMQGEATMSLDLSWRTDTADHNRSWTLMQTTNLQSSFITPRKADDHLDEHWKVKSLLVLLFGRPLAYREHAVVSQIAYYDDVGQPDGDRKKFFPPRPFLTSRTLRDAQTTPSEEIELGEAIAYLRDIGPEGLTRWAEAWDDSWERLIAPTVAVLGRARPFVEDQILAAGIFLDAWGKTAERAEGEKDTYSSSNNPTFATFAYRAMKSTPANWTHAALTDAGLAIAIRDVYTAVKHAEKQQPTAHEMFLLSDVMLLLVRLIAARKIDTDGSLVTSFVASHRFEETLDGFARENLIVNALGQVTPRIASSEQQLRDGRADSP